MDEITQTIGEHEALIYTKNDCSNCESTKDLMDELEISYITVNMDEVPNAKSTVKALGFRQAPVVITRESNWSGFAEQKIRALKPRDLSADDDIWA